jgi:hypothetical protein
LAIDGWLTRPEDWFLVVIWAAMAVVFGALGYKEYSSGK